MNRYIQYSKVLKQIVVDKGNFKTVLFREFKGDIKLKEAYGILIKAVKNYEKISQIAEEINTKNKKEVIGNDQLFCILVIEQFFSKKKKIEGGGQLKKIITENKEFISSRLDLSENESTDLIRTDVHFRLIERSNLNANNTKTSKKQKNKKNNDNVDGNSVEIEEQEKQQNTIVLPDVLATATKDEHIKNLFSLPYADYQAAIAKDASKVLDSTEYLIQSKSSALPVFFLFSSVINQDKSDNFDLIDCCAAPGNKTMQAAEYLQGRGIVFAFEKDPARYQLLQERVDKYGFSSAITAKRGNFLEEELTAKQYSNVKYCVADPSCSGTGMLNHIFFDEESKELIKAKYGKMNFKERTEQMFSQYDQKMQMRIKGLGEFQLKILTQLATLPNLNAFSYSTCSIHQQENEDVVTQFLKSHKDFELIEAYPAWQTRGFVTDSLPEGKKCIRVDPFQGKSDGFFVAIFQRKKKDN